MLVELNKTELEQISGGAALSDFGEWLTDKIAKGIHLYHTAIYNIQNHKMDSGSRLESIAHG